MTRNHLRILITTDWYTKAVNGVVTSVVNLKDELERQGHEVMIVTLSDTMRSHRDGNVLYLASVNANAVYAEARARLHIKRKWMRQIQAFGPDIVHSQCEFSTYKVAKRIARRLHIPLVHTYHTVYEDYTHYVIPSHTLGVYAARTLSRSTCNKADCVIAPTDKVRKILEKYQIKPPIVTIPSGLKMEQFQRMEPVSEEAVTRASIGISEDIPVLLYLGRLAKEKNLEEIFSYLKYDTGGPKAIIIVGDGPYRPALEKKAKQLPDHIQVIFTGMVSPNQVQEYYKLGDLFVSASQSETQGLTYVEAAACGLPLLCRSDACLDAIVLHQKNGWTYQSEGEFKKYLRRFLEMDPKERDQMGRASEAVAENLNIQVIVPKVLEVYQTLIEEKHKKR